MCLDVRGSLVKLFLKSLDILGIKPNLKSISNTYAFQYSRQVAKIHWVFLCPSCVFLSFLLQSVSSSTWSTSWFLLSSYIPTPALFILHFHLPSFTSFCFLFFLKYHPLHAPLSQKLSSTLLASWKLVSFGATDWLTAGELRVAEPQLQAGGGWMLFSAIWRIQEQPQLQLQGVQDRLDQGVVGLIWHVHQVLAGKEKKTDIDTEPQCLTFTIVMWQTELTCWIQKTKPIQSNTVVLMQIHMQHLKNTEFKLRKKTQYEYE